MARRAVKLKFKSYGPFLEYLNQTIFYHLYDASLFDTTSRDLFLDDYISIVSKLLRQAEGEDILKVLYYVPLGFFIKIDRKFLWEVLDETLKGNVTNANTNTEDIVLHIFKGIAKSTNNNDAFLSEMLKKHGEKKTRFSLLYDKLNGDNFKTLVSLIHNIWFQSSFRNPDNKLYKKSDEKYNIEGSPFVVNYEANKEATFFYSNKNISWVNANLLKYEPDTSWWDEIATVLNPALGEAVKQFTETEKSFFYHPFQPIAIKDFDKQQTGVTLAAPLMPAFVLKAGEDKAFWDNVTTATEYAIDIVTTFSGVGNLAKLRHLAKVASKANKLKFVSRAGKVVANAKAITRGAVGVIEISSGTVNALLKITNVRDEKWAKELSEFLLILELLTLGADLGEFLLKRARNSAKNALEYEDEIRKQLDDVVIEDGKASRKLTEAEKGKFFDELYEVAEKTRNAGKYTIQNEGIISIAKFNKIAKRIKKEYGVDMFLVDRNSEKWAELFKRWQNKPLEGMWVDQPLNSKNYPGIKLDGPALYLFRGVTTKGVYEVTSYTVQHELFHLKMWNRIKELYPKNYLTKFHEIPDEIHETFVLSEFVKAKKYTKWSDNDILADLKAFNENFARNMNLADFEKFDLETYIKNLK